MLPCNGGDRLGLVVSFRPATQRTIQQPAWGRELQRHPLSRPSFRRLLFLVAVCCYAIGFFIRVLGMDVKGEGDLRVEIGDWKDDGTRDGQ
ncbi:MAG: hypothetical protein DWG76_04995 [Chloroflexi bacterium]|nr:hypothetical protein [Chloroflexota bacterium]